MEIQGQITNNHQSVNYILKLAKKKCIFRGSIFDHSQLLQAKMNLLGTKNETAAVESAAAVS